MSADGRFLSDTVAPAIRNTSTVDTTDYARKSLIKKAYPIRYGKPVKEPIKYYGTIQVMP